MVRTLLAAALPVLLAVAPVRSQATSAATGDRAIPEWLVIGTFPVDTGAQRLARDYLGGERDAAPSAGAAVGAKQWARAVSDPDGRLDFNRLFEAPLERAAGYALAYIEAPTERSVGLALESDDDAVAWLNGRLIYRAEVARGIGQADTIGVRLSRGTNRLLVKVINRTGGFGVGARLLGTDPGAIADLRVTAVRPAGPLATEPSPLVTLAPAKLGTQARLKDGELLVELGVDVARWGTLAGDVQLRVGRQAVVVPPSLESLPVRVRLELPWPELARLLEGAAVQVVTPTQRSAVPIPLAAGDLLAVLSRTIQPVGWEWTRDGADWRPEDAWRGDTVRAVRLRTRVPATLAGFTLTADVAEFVPASTFRVNGRAVSPDADERILVCTPCTAGQSLELQVDIQGDWWDLPRLRVEEIGWRELDESARYGRTLFGDSVPALDPAAARTLLAQALRPDKRAYLAEVERLRARYRAWESIRADTIDLVGNSHIDAAWLWRWPETVEVVRNTWRTAAKLLDKYPEMKFAASSAKYYTWLEEYEPELLARIQELARQGRWLVTGGWWVEPDVNTPSGESLARQGLYGQRTLLRLFGAPATVGWIPDTFGYPWTLPQLMAQAGLTSFVTQKLRWNDNGWSADRNFFWWEGPDGTRMPTYIPFGYDHDLRASRLAREWRTQQDSAATGRVLTLYGVGDHGGGPTMEMLDRRRDAARVPVLPALRDTDPAASLAIMIRTAPAAPVIRDELYFEYHRGVQTSQAAMKQWNRRMEALLLAAERAALVAGGEYPRAPLTLAWQKTLFNQFHDILPGSSIGPVYEDATVDYRAADSIAGGVLQAALARIAARLDTRPPARGAVPFVVFNATSSARSDLVALPRAGVERPRVLDRRGRALPSHIRGDSVHVLVPDVPPLGSAVVFLAEGGRAAEPGHGRGYVLENDSLRVEIDRHTGAIARLFDKRLGRDVLAPGAQGNVLMTMPDTPKDWDAWNVDHTDGPWTAVDSAVTVGQVSRTPLGDELTVLRARPDVHAQQRYFLPRHAARLDVVSTIAWHASHRLLKAFFPLAVGADSVWAEIPYGAVPRIAVPRTRSDSAKFELPMQRWIDASRHGWGVSLVNDGKHGYDVRGDTLRLSLLRAPKYPDPNADMGTHRFTYSIVPHAGDWRAGATFAAAEALNRPLRVERTDAHSGAAMLPPPLALMGEGVELGALKQAEAGDTWIVRLAERYGRPASASLSVPGAIEWREVDLVERGLGAWQPVTSGSITLPLGAWKIRTVEVRVAR